MGDEDMNSLLAEATAGMEKANHTVAVIGTRLANTHGDVVELRSKIASLALVTAVDPTHEPELVEARRRLAEAESQMRELGAAQHLATTMACEARRKVLRASAQEDWDAAVAALDEALVTAAAADDMTKQLGDLYRRLLTELRTAAGLVARHLERDEHKLMVQPPNLDDALRTMLANVGGPQVDPRSTLHLSAAERSQVSIAAAVADHGRRVMSYRPATVTEPEDADHG
jgi:hypothetical protein